MMNHSEIYKTYQVRISPVKTKLNKYNDHYSFKWTITEDKVIVNPEDFIFVMQSLNEVFSKINEINILNPELIKAVCIKDNSYQY